MHRFPPGLVHEGELMLRTLLADLAACPGVELLCSRDARLPPIHGIESIRVGSGDDSVAAFARGAASADAVWPTAPETARALEHPCPAGRATRQDAARLPAGCRARRGEQATDR